ncbi:Undecaprenyl-phosphate mannosyltransferase [Rubripirellula lacrimiformis]|uniref:Undecaprenyl-phosphate mannosyltransferase n=2 Tax=Rubripirellula lacrimiformis TaxID=1930273 RepID=A0A517NIK4_9BACT|nr:Undecaprenyl-phosphate mannosyltransferase [Rubripirellula lacrimiformis]
MTNRSSSPNDHDDARPRGGELDGVNRGWLAALPVYNEVQYVDGVLDEVTRYASDVLVVNDGSSDGTAEVLDRRSDVRVVHHPVNRGYGAALMTAFEYAIAEGYEGIVTLDCDGQHQPKRIPEFIAAAKDVDIVSGSRYLKVYEGDSAPPEERMFINRRITRELNQRLGYELTDAFCGFKAYRTSALRRIEITDPGYAMPLQLWVEAAAADLRVVEIPVPLIYLDLERSFGGSLDHAETRLRYYHQVLDDAFASAAAAGRDFPARDAALCV